MSVAENSQCVMDRNKKKQRNFATSETEYFVRSSDKNAENTIFGHIMSTHQSLKKDIMLGITAGARKTGKLHMQ